MEELKRIITELELNVIGESTILWKDFLKVSQ